MLNDDDDFGYQVFSLVGLVSLPGGGTIRVVCGTGLDGVDVLDVKLLATAVSRP